jgi:PPOX class probable F420-dependent enzyme
MVDNRNVGPVSMREAMRMDDGEVEAFLAAGFRSHVSTLNRDGSPHVVPISYVVLNGRLTFWADNSSQKVVNLQRDPRIACVVDDGVEFQELRGVEIIGTAELIDDQATSERVADLFSLKAPEEHRDAARSTLLALAAERTVVSVQPRRVSSWDHNKLFGVKPQDIGH